MFKITRYPSIASYILYFFSFFITALAIKFLKSNQITLIFWEITSLFASPINFPVILDPVGLTFSAVVLFISANVLIFTNTYIQDDPFINRFVLLVLAFVLSINILIFFPHLFTLLLGWDGLGLISFLLVIYYQNAKSLAGGLLTALTNRVGDAFLLIAIALSLNQNHWTITNIWASPIIIALTLCILTARITKRAQIPFSRWLPAAIAAPTPVSALVHSSTLVTAGVFLLIRLYPILHLTPWFNLTLLLTACFTTLIAGLRAITECDLKKIIALSTLRQLGVIMTSLGLGYITLTLFHLLTHALFKALLFLCAGNVIHTHLHRQDLRTVGNLTNQIPLTSSCFLIANMALCGAPFLAGFYSKDTILELSLWFPINLSIILIIFLGTALTAIYSTRFFIYLLISFNSHPPLIKLTETDNKVTNPILLLTLGAIMGGGWLFWIFFPYSQSPVLPLIIKIFTIIIILFASFIILINNTKNFRDASPILLYPAPFYAHSYIWFLTPLSTQWIIKYPLNMSHKILIILDQSWVEGVVSQSGHKLSTISSNFTQTLQKNTINTYIFLSLLTLPIYLIIFTYFDSLSQSITLKLLRRDIPQSIFIV